MGFIWFTWGNGGRAELCHAAGASDYKEAVALGALGVVTGVLTGFAAVPTGPKKVMELVSNVLSDDTVFYVARPGEFVLPGSAVAT